MEQDNDLKPPAGSTSVTIKSYSLTIEREQNRSEHWDQSPEVISFPPLSHVVSVLFELEFINKILFHVNVD